jgi:hypothetical protein
VLRFTNKDWDLIADKYFLKMRTGLQCRKRWYFIQDLSGTKTKWSDYQSNLLKNISKKYLKNNSRLSSDEFAVPVQWSCIAKKLNQNGQKGDPYRTPR